MGYIQDFIIADSNDIIYINIYILIGFLRSFVFILEVIYSDAHFKSTVSNMGYVKNQA